MAQTKLTYVATLITALSVTIILIVTGNFMKILFGLSTKLEQFRNSLNIDAPLFLLLIFVGMAAFVSLVFYVGLRFEQRGTPSNRTLAKIQKQVGDEPFTLEKANGEWVATVVDKNKEEV